MSVISARPARRRRTGDVAAVFATGQTIPGSRRQTISQGTRIWSNSAERSEVFVWGQVRRREATGTYRPGSSV